MKPPTNPKRILALGLSIILASAATQAAAAVVTLNSEFEFSNGTPPASTMRPWLTTTFDDGGGTGSVLLTLTAAHLTGGEFVSGWYLNLDVALDVEDLEFSEPTKIGSFTTPTINLGTDAYKSDGDGTYDILLSFATSDGAPTRFTAGDSLTYTITGIPTLTAESFDCLSTTAGGHGPHTHAAHVQGIGPDGELSGWVTGPCAPEPTSIGLLILGSLALVRRRR